MINSQKNQIVSVIMSVYNDEKNIQNSVESILNQTYKNIELLLVDDGSTDNTYRIINLINDKRLKIFKNKTNIGLTKSLNFLINKANSNFIARQDSDDISLPTRFERQLSFLVENNLDVCTSRAQIIQNQKVIPNLSYYLPNKLVIKYKNPFIHGTLMMKTNLLKDLGCYDERFYYAQDYKLFKDLMNRRIKIGILKEPLYKLNIVDNISTLNIKEQRYYADCVRKNLTPIKSDIN